MTHDDEMKTANAEFEKFLEGSKAEGRVVRVSVPKVDVKGIRIALGMSQSDFSGAFALRLNSVRNWEQRIREPDAAARAYLLVIKHAPEVVMKALAQEFNEAGVEKLSGVRATLGCENVHKLRPNEAGESNAPESDQVSNNEGSSPKITIPSQASAKLSALESGTSPSELAASSVKINREADEARGKWLACADFGFAKARFEATDDAQIAVCGLRGFGFDELILNGHDYSLTYSGTESHRVVDLGLSEFAAYMAMGSVDVTIRRSTDHN